MSADSHQASKQCSGRALFCHCLHFLILLLLVFFVNICNVCQNVLYSVTDLEHMSVRAPAWTVRCHMILPLGNLRHAL